MTAIVKIHRDQKEGSVLANAIHAKTFFARLRGLLGRAPLSRNEGMLISPCNQVHTLGMAYSLDVVYLDKHGVVLKCVENLRPYRLSMAPGARHTLELAVDSIRRFELKPGDKLVWN